MANKEFKLVLFHTEDQDWFKAINSDIIFDINISEDYPIILVDNLDNPEDAAAYLDAQYEMWGHITSSIRRAQIAALPKQCQQRDCTNKSEYHIYWPGQETTQCGDCTRKVQETASIM